MNTKKICLGIVLAVLFFHVINNYIILSLDTTFPTYDEWDHLREAVYSCAFFKGLKISPGIFESVYNWYIGLGDRCRPPLYRVVLTMVCAVQRILSADAAILMVNTLFLAVLLFSVYGIGVKLHSRFAGALAAFIVSVFPGIFTISRVLMVDFALTAMTTLSVYLMLCARKFSDTRYALLFGLSMGLGLLTKVPYISFIAPVLLGYIIISAMENTGENKGAGICYKNILIAVITAVFVAGTWYLPNISSVFQRSAAVAWKLRNNPVSTFSFYVRNLRFNQMGNIFSFSAIFAFLFCLRKKETALLVVWAAAPFLVFLASHNVSARFILPCFPAVALAISCCLVGALPGQMWRTAAAGAVLFFGLSVYFAICYGGAKTVVTEKPDSCFYSSVRIDHGILSPLNVDWEINGIEQLILREFPAEKEDKRINILTLFNYAEVSDVLEYYLIKRGINAKVGTPARGDLFDGPRIECAPDIGFFHFVIKKTGSIGENGSDIDWLKLMNDAFEAHQEQFCLVGSVQNLPDHSTVRVFKNLEMPD